VSVPLEKRLDGLRGERQVVVGRVAEERGFAGRLHFIKPDRRDDDEQRLETLHERLGGQWSAGLRTGRLWNVSRRGRLVVRSRCCRLIACRVVRRGDLQRWRLEARSWSLVLKAGGDCRQVGRFVVLWLLDRSADGRQPIGLVFQRWITEPRALPRSRSA
jgi:hypothetical protein